MLLRLVLILDVTLLAGVFHVNHLNHHFDSVFDVTHDCNYIPTGSRL